MSVAPPGKGTALNFFSLAGLTLSGWNILATMPKSVSAP